MLDERGSHAWEVMPASRPGSHPHLERDPDNLTANGIDIPDVAGGDDRLAQGIVIAMVVLVNALIVSMVLQLRRNRKQP